MDLRSIHAVYEKEMRGQPPYDPRMMTKLLVYGYCVGVYSARKMQRQVKAAGIRLKAYGKHFGGHSLKHSQRIELPQARLAQAANPHIAQHVVH